jgi:hypothetical protein
MHPRIHAPTSMRATMREINSVQGFFIHATSCAT